MCRSVCCRSAYANSIFCETFHKHQAGWRECNDCGKPIHCGCIVSRSLFEYRDSGGIDCVTCAQASQLRLMRATENLNAVRSIKNNANDRHTEHIDGRLMVDGAGKGKMVQLCRIVEASEPSRWPQSEREVIDSCNGLNKQDDTRFSNVMKPPSHSLAITTSENNGPTWVTGSMDKSHPLNISIGTSSGNSVLTSALESLEERLEGKALSSPFHQGQRSLSMKMEGLIPPQERIARPPADGIGKSLLLSRYWPKMTDHELEKLSECMKSIVVPLFEKTLSSSDASRIGRLVLPKSCAEVYFPPITQSEGLPLQMLDVMGNEWIFQFRFWPNNNSRMYVLEGVTPCMQALQLNAGDTVIFSQMHPGGKYVFGFRRASENMSLLNQDAMPLELYIQVSVSWLINLCDLILLRNPRQTMMVFVLFWIHLFYPLMIQLLFNKFIISALAVIPQSLNSASKEMSPKELDNILTTSKDLKKRRSIRKPDTAQEHEPHGLNALASAAALGDDLVEPVGATTKHPRHRLGCSCIVCSQPPSGKGKHKPTCTCIACVTMKRRCNTLMARKRKRGQSDDDALARDEGDTNGAPRDQIDLNSHPYPEDMQVDA
uniref:B3 domain-containing protein Os07g0679700 family n=1 Tax=Cajanus cajan TaxID=3821 RepID=A0A151U151_CAJCA|nr:B3 domain-containing protein Os07g0679700 family [Cajanus cajan]